MLNYLFRMYNVKNTKPLPENSHFFTDIKKPPQICGGFINDMFVSLCFVLQHFFVINGINLLSKFCIFRYCMRKEQTGRVVIFLISYSISE